MEDLSFGLYSGYVNLDDSKNKAYHYVAALSENDYQTDPVMIWFNGGPPCSSLIGMLSENGPYLITEAEEDSFHLNTYRWNKEVTMIWLESPAGVGFSKCSEDFQNFSQD